MQPKKEKLWDLLGDDAANDSSSSSSSSSSSWDATFSNRSSFNTSASEPKIRHSNEEISPQDNDL